MHGFCDGKLSINLMCDNFGQFLKPIFLMQVTYVALRWLRPVDYIVVTFFYGLYSVIECFICSAVTNTLELPKTEEDWFLAITMAAMAFFGQSCFTMALKFEDAGPISLIRTLEVPFTFLWQIVFLSELPDIWR